MIIFTVLKSGGIYKPEHVYRLAGQIHAHNKAATVYCLTDMILEPESVCGVVRLQLRNAWPSWWAKIELFRDDLPEGPAIYLDLDTTVLGSLAPVEKQIKGFTMLQDVNHLHDVGSGIMGWIDRPRGIYEAFAADPVEFIARYKGTGMHGDQAFIRDHVGEPINRFKFGPLLSFKKHCRASGVPVGTAIVYFHGHPKPWQPEGLLRFCDDWRAPVIEQQP